MMGPMADLDALLAGQAEAARLAIEMSQEKDPARLQEMAGQLQARCAELERAARTLETPDGGGAQTRVVLTAEQRQRVVEQTGVGVEVVTLRDTPGRQWSKEMPRIEPREIEAAAARQAAAARLAAETRSQMEKIAAELEKLGIPEVADTIADLRRNR